MLSDLQYFLAMPQIGLTGLYSLVGAPQTETAHLLNKIEADAADSMPSV